MDKQALLATLPEIIAQTCDLDIEWTEDPTRAYSQIRRGHAGVRESWERWLEGFEQYSFEVEQIIDGGDDVLVLRRGQAQGATSGTPVHSRTCAVMTIRDGKLLRYRELSDERAARRAAGLGE